MNFLFHNAYDPARNGEGFIVEWLTNGDVLVVFFTYDPDGNQFWLFGQAAASGKTVSNTLTFEYDFSMDGFGAGVRNYTRL